MKNAYVCMVQWLVKPQLHFLLLLLLALPFLGRTQTLSFTELEPNLNPGNNSSTNPQYFGQTPVGSASVSKSYSVSGSDLDASANVVVVIPADFAGSTDNNAFSTATLVLTADAAGTLSATTVYLRFAPTGGAGTTINRTVYAQTSVGGDPLFTSPTTKLRGDALAGAPAITVTPSALGFGNQVIGTSSGGMNVTVNATSVGTTPITVTAPTGFLVSYNGSAYAATASIAPTNGAVTGAVVSVVFAPTVAQNYVGNVTFVSGTATNSVSVSGVGILATPVLTLAPKVLPFGTVVVGAATASQSFSVSGSNLQGNVTIAVPAGFQIRIGANFFAASSIVLAPANDGTLASTTIDVRFAPTQSGTYNDAVTVTTPNNSGTVSENVAVTGSATASSGAPVLIVNPGSVDFGTITSSGGSVTRTFEVSGTDLTADVVLTPSSGNIQLRNASAGGSFSGSPLVLSSTNGTVGSQVIEVRLVSLVAPGSFSQRIDITSGPAATVVTVTGQNPSGATSDISVSNPGSNNYTFVTRPNTVSVAQTFFVAATNLVQPLVVQAVGPNASYFLVSADGVNYFASLSFTPNINGNVTQRPIYVHFVPGVTPITVTSTIRNSSAPAPDFDVSVTGISEPTIRLNRAIGAFADNVVKSAKTAPATVRLEGFLLDGDVEFRFPADATDPTRNPTQVPQFEFSLNNGTTYVKQATISPDADGNFAAELLVRYAPVRVGNAAQELQFRNASFVNNTFFSLTSGFGRTTGFAIAVEPTAQSTATVQRSSDGTSATITFDLASPPTGTSYGQTRLVIGSSTYSVLPANLFPLDKQNFNPGTTTGNGDYNYGTGTATEAASNTFVVFSGANNSFTITNLDPALTYKFFGFEFNNDGVLNAENYLVPNNQPLFPLPVALTRFAAARQAGGVRLAWATASEKNSARFDVQRSLDGRAFATVLSVAAQGTSSQAHEYTALDAKAPASRLYYRLRQVDLDGTVVFSPVVAVAGTNATAELVLYPNPASDHVVATLPAVEGRTYRVLNPLGQVFDKGTAEAENPTVDVRALPAGTYLLELNDRSGRQVRRFVKAN